MKKLYEQSPEMQLSGKCQLRHVKCTHHKGYLMEDLSMIKSGFYEISFCKSGDFMRSAFVKAEIFCSASARNGILLQMVIFWLFHRIFHTTLLPVISLQTIMILSLYGWKNHIFPIWKASFRPLRNLFSILTHLIFFILPISYVILRKNLKPFTGNMLLMGSFLKPMPVVHPPVFW